MSSLVVSCRCGQSFAASPELAGQTLPCPACGSPITVGAPPVAAHFAPASFAPQAPVVAHQSFGAAPAMPNYGAPAPNFGVPGFGQGAYGPAQPADPFAMSGYGQPNSTAMPAVGGSMSGGDIGASTTVKVLIGVAVGVVVLLVGAIVGEQAFGKKDKGTTTVVAAPVASTPAASTTRPVASVPAPVAPAAATPKPAPVSTPAPTTSAAAPPGMQAYTVPGQFTLFIPPEYSWQTGPQQSLGRGVTANSYIGTRHEHSVVTVSIISTSIKAQKDRRDFMRGASNGMSRGMGGAMTIVSSRGFEATGTIPDRVEVELTLQAINGNQVHGKGFISFGKKKTSMVVAMAQDLGVRDQLMQSVNSYKEL